MTEPRADHVPPPDLEHSSRTATAADFPCQLYTYHAPIVSRTQLHHTKPIYLQYRLWGEVRFDADLWVCGSCHDSIHEWLGWLLGETRQPNPEPGRKAKAAAQATFDWYRGEQAILGKL